MLIVTTRPYCALVVGKGTKSPNLLTMLLRSQVLIQSPPPPSLPPGPFFWNSFRSAKTRPIVSTVYLIRRERASCCWKRGSFSLQTAFVKRLDNGCDATSILKYFQPSPCGSSSKPISGHSPSRTGSSAFQPQRVLRHPFRGGTWFGLSSD